MVTEQKQNKLLQQDQNPMQYFWAKEGKERLTLVGSNRQRTLSEPEYLVLLEDRAQDLAEKSENIWENLESVLPSRELALLTNWRESRKLGNLGEDLILHSRNSWTILPQELNGVKFPIQLKQDSRLKEIYSTTNLLEWLQESYPRY